MKNLLYVILTLVVLLIVGALAAPYFISSDTIKTRIAEQVEKSTGHKMEIAGAFRMTFFPSAGVHMENVTLYGPAGSDAATPLAKLKSLDVSVAVMPLVHGAVQVETLTLDTPEINLIAGANGQNNWSFGSAPATPPSPATGEKPKPQQTVASGFALNNLQLSHVNISDGTVSYTDNATKKKALLQKLDLKASLDSITSPLSMETSFTWNGKDVAFKTTVHNLQDLLTGKSTDIKAALRNDYLNFTADGALADQAFKGKVNLDSPSLRDAMNWFNETKPTTAGAKLATKISSNAECSKSFCNLTGGDFSVDSIDAKGDVKLNLTGKVPSLDLKLATDTLDLNPFLPQPEAKQAALQLVTDAQAATTGWSTAPMDFSPLRSANAKISISAGTVKVKDIVITKTVFNSTLQDGKLTGEMADAGFYDGKAGFSFAIDAGGTISKKMSLKDVNAQNFLKAAGATDRMSGKLNMDASITAHGNSEASIISSLAGNGSANVTNGVLTGVTLQDLATKFVPFNLSQSSNKKTEFSQLGGTFTIAQGIVSNKDLAIVSPNMKLSGAGDLNLPERTVNYKLTPQTVASAKQAGGAAREGLAVPILITGSIDNPQFAPDLQGVLTNALKDPKSAKAALKNSGAAIKQQLGLGKTKNADGTTKKTNVKDLLGGFR